MAEILTVPTKIKNCRVYLASGNEYLSFPEIRPAGGGINSITVLHEGSRGLVEFTGTGRLPLLAPYLKIDGRPAALRMVWSYRLHWLPVFSAAAGEVAVQGLVFAPPGHRGAVYLLKVRNNGERPLLVEAGFNLAWDGCQRRIFRSRPLAQLPVMEYDRWTKSLLCECGDAYPVAALAVGLEREEPWWRRSATEGLQADAASVFTLQPGEERHVPLYLAVNQEGSGATTTVVDFRRRGWRRLLTETESWLKARRVALSAHTALANRNLFFNYFFALGRAIDSDRWLPVTSRSPKYYVSAAFWARDTLLWSFPGLLLTDAATAREVLLAVFERHLERAGEHAHYIDGTLLYPGFELDQLAAYLLALKHYLQATGDRAVLANEQIKRALPQLMAKFLQWYDADVGFCTTFLDPSDDPPRYPYLIYSNALAQRALSFLARLAGKSLTLPGDPKQMALAIRTAIYRHGVVKGPFGPMFAWAVDGRGNFELYDNPPGSLLLLPYYGFCRREDPVWQHTVRWICSGYNPYRRAGRVLAGTASRHAGDPWPLAAASELLAGRTEAGGFFAAAKLDSGFFCESVDAETGRAATGQAFASAAGFLGFALYQAFRKK